MLNETTVNMMQSMKLFGMVQGFTQRLGDPKHAELSHAEMVGLLVQDEKTYRDNQKLKRLLKRAKMKQQAALEDIDYRHPRGLTRQVMLELANNHWIDTHRNVLVTGPTGVGKSFIACALGNFAARAGCTVYYIRAPRMFASLQESRGDGTLVKSMTKLGRVQVLIIDDLLLAPLSDMERKDLLEIVEDRYDCGATIITSQCPLKDWHQNIGDPTLADAICDRLFHNAYKFALKGESIRPENGKRKSS